jgi:hypothetical protein
MPTRHRRGVAKKGVSGGWLGLCLLVIDQNAGPEEKIPIYTCGLGDFARGSVACELLLLLLLLHLL